MKSIRAISLFSSLFFLIVACNQASPIVSPTKIAASLSPLTTTTPPIQPSSNKATATQKTSLPQLTSEGATIFPSLPSPTCQCAENQPTIQFTETPSPGQEPLSAPPAGDLYAVVGVSPEDVLNLRSEPGVSNPTVGTIPPDGVGIARIQPEQTVDSTQWAQVNYNGMVGWVNTNYLAQQSGNPQPGLASAAMRAIQAIKQQDFATLASQASPNGVRFSPYAFIQPEDLVFSPIQMKDLSMDSNIYHWGSYDGSGLPIDLSFESYLKEFIYDVDFAQPNTIGFNSTLGVGSRINNIAEFYPDAAWVEFHFPGFDPQFAGMDWRSLWLVFSPNHDDWELVGIVHDEWGP